MPETVAPFAGAVIAADSAAPFCTVTVRLAVAVAPVLSRTVRPRVWPPLEAVVVLHEYVVAPPEVSGEPSRVSV